MNGLLSVAGSGIPGVGVAPGDGEVLTFTFAAFGIPGVDSADGGIGLADIPAGRLFASTFVTTFAFVPAGCAKLFELFPVVDDPQAAPIAATEDRRISFLIIVENVPLKFKYSCAGLKVASPEDSDGVQTGTGRYKRNSEGVNGRVKQPLNSDYSVRTSIVNAF